MRENKGDFINVPTKLLYYQFSFFSTPALIAFGATNTIYKGAVDVFLKNNTQTIVEDFFSSLCGHPFALFDKDEEIPFSPKEILALRWLSDACKVSEAQVLSPMLLSAFILLYLASHYRKNLKPSFIIKCPNNTKALQGNTQIAEISPYRQSANYFFNQKIFEAVKPAASFLFQENTIKKLGDLFFSRYGKSDKEYMIPAQYNISLQKCVKECSFFQNLEKTCTLFFYGCRHITGFLSFVLSNCDNYFSSIIEDGFIGPRITRYKAFLKIYPEEKGKIRLLHERSLKYYLEIIQKLQQKDMPQNQQNELDDGNLKNLI